MTRIVTAAEGNPLYVEQIVSMLVESGMLRREDGRWVSTVALADIPIPPTIQALLAARLDLLGPAERAIVEPASVIGHVFAREAVEHLVALELAPAVASQLVSLTNKQLVRPEPGGADDLYRFHHILIRDAAYRSLLKRARAALHERFVEWAEQVNRDRDRSVEYDEILGYHLEQAHDYLVELGPLDDHGRSIGVRGSEKLAAAGIRAFARGDMSAAANLLRRAAALRSASDPERLRLLPPLAEAMMEIGEFAWAQAVLDDAMECGDARLRAAAELTRLLVLHHTTDDLSAWRHQVVETTERVIPQLETLAAHQELAHAWRLLGFVHGSVCRWGEQVAAVEQALSHARAAGDLRLEARLSAAYTIGLRDGPTTVPNAILGCAEIVDRRLPDRQAEAIATASLACLLAMAGDFEAARERYRAARDLLAEFGGTVLTAFTAIAGARVELLDGDAAGAERELAPAYDALGRIGERYFRPLVGPYLARALLETGKLEQAARVAGDAAADADQDDVEAQALLACVRAQIDAQAGDPERAVEIVAAAVDAARTTDSPVLQADVLVEAGRVLAAAHRSAQAEAAFASAEALYRAKGDTVSAARLGETLDGAATSYAGAGMRSRLPPTYPNEEDRPPPAR